MSSSTSRAEVLLAERAQRDLEEGIHHNARRIRESGHPFLARAMDAAVMGAISLIQLRERFKEDVRFVCALARRVNAGEDPATVAAENVAHAMRLKELALVAREKDPEFAGVIDRARSILAKRLPDLGRMVAVEDPADYDDLVRKAFPDRARVDLIVEENRVDVLSVIDHIAKHPHLLRVPRAWVPKMRDIATEVVEWETARVKKGVDEIYAVPATA